MQLTSRVPAVKCGLQGLLNSTAGREKLHNPVWSISPAYRRQAGTGEQDIADSGEISTDSRQHIADSRQHIADSR